MITDTEKAEAKMIEMVRPMISFGMVLRKTFTSSFPFIRFQIIRKRRAALVVFTPPPVDPGEAPINMRMMRIRIVSLAKSPISTVLNPAVRGVTDWKKEARIFVWRGSPLMI